ncbi:hypothetical protein R4P64_09095 [Rhodococcus sp. IEGM 1366]|uniref:hypothetical protein n=1 Tax=Rhodococcus sp. IEGM 1366 TaxID=3082223 RepID=UPI0029534DB2|nr:hypothetical protein [Rhodococcus sp. IEGM 1366]MDV8066663.1 hypothetical protein [Rhodococcus sp. IEGM 1366]
MIAVGVVELALVHEGVVVCVTDAPTGGAGAVDELVDRLVAAEVERNRDLRGGLRSADELLDAADAYMSRLPSMTYRDGAGQGRATGLTRLGRRSAGAHVDASPRCDISFFEMARLVVQLRDEYVVIS